MLESLFTSRTRVRILELFLLSERGEEHHIRDVARRAKVTPIYARKELERLAEAGLLRKRRRGNMVLYRAYTGFPLYEELRALFTKGGSVGTSIRRDLSERFGDRVKCVMLKGDSSGKSIDVLIVGNPSRDELLGAIWNIQKETEKKVNFELLSHREFKEKKDELESAGFLVVR